MPHVPRSSDPSETDFQAVRDSEHSAHLVTAAADGKAAHVLAEGLESFEEALRGRPEIVGRMEAVIADPSKAVPSRHHQSASQ